MFKRKVIGEYRLGRTIGEGAFSKVKIGYHVVTGDKVAIKIISKAKLEEDRKKEQERQQRQEQKEKSKDTNNPKINLDLKKDEKEELKAPPPVSISNDRDKGGNGIKQNQPEVKVAEPAYDQSASNGSNKAVHGNSHPVVAMTNENDNQHNSGNQTHESKDLDDTNLGPNVDREAIKRHSTSSDNSNKKQTSENAENPESGLESPRDDDVVVKVKPPQPESNTRQSEIQLKVDQKEEEEYIPENIRHLSLEVKLLMRLNHPNVIKLYQLMETPTEFFVIMQHAGGGEIVDYIESHQGMNEDAGRHFFRQLVSALDHCHEAGVVHRDLKLENLLLSDDQSNLLISDFGLGRSFVGRKHYLGTFCGTPLYASPEIVSGEKYIGPPTDVWSAGVVLFVMLHQAPPFKAETLNSLYKKIKNVEYKMPEKFSPELRDLMTKIFVRDPSKRITVEQMRAHPWVCQKYNAPPPKIPPKFINVDESPLDKKYGALIIGITHENDTMLYQFNEPAGVIQNRRQSITISVSNERKGFERRHSTLGPVDTTSPNRRRSSFMMGASAHAEEPNVFDVGVEDRKEAFTLKGGDVTPDRRPSQVSVPGRRASIVQGLPQKVSQFNQPPESLAARSRRFTMDDYKSDSFTGNSRDVMPFAPTGRPEVTGAPLIRRPSSVVSDPTAKGLNFRRPSASALDFLPPGASQVNEPVNSFLDTPIQTVKIPFTTSTTCSDTPESVVDRIKKVLVQQNIPYYQVSKFIIECQHVSGIGDEVSFEVEVCKVWLLRLTGVKIHRISGDQAVFKKLNDLIVQKLKL